MPANVSCARVERGSVNSRVAALLPVGTPGQAAAQSLDRDDRAVVARGGADDVGHEGRRVRPEAQRPARHHPALRVAVDRDAAPGARVHLPQRVDHVLAAQLDVAEVLGQLARLVRACSTRPLLGGQRGLRSSTRSSASLFTVVPCEEQDRVARRARWSGPAAGEARGEVRRAWARAAVPVRSSGAYSPWACAPGARRGQLRRDKPISHPRMTRMLRRRASSFTPGDSAWRFHA